MRSRSGRSARRDPGSRTSSPRSRRTSRPSPSSQRAHARAPPGGSLDEQELTVAVARVLAGADPGLSEPVVGAWAAHVAERIPLGVARVVEAVVRALLERPI